MATGAPGLAGPPAASLVEREQDHDQEAVAVLPLPVVDKVVQDQVP